MLGASTRTRCTTTSTGWPTRCGPPSSELGGTRAENERLQAGSCGACRAELDEYEQVGDRVNEQVVELFSQAQLIAEEMVEDVSRDARERIGQARAHERKIVEEALYTAGQQVRSYARSAQAQMQSIMESFASEVDRLGAPPGGGRGRGEPGPHRPAVDDWPTPRPPPGTGAAGVRRLALSVRDLPPEGRDVLTQDHRCPATARVASTVPPVPRWARPTRAGPPDRRHVEVDRAEAEEFLELFHAENPQAGPAGPRIAEVHARDRRDRDLLAHPRGAGVRRPGRLAQQRTVHRPAVLAQPAGARPADGLRRRRRRRALLRAPAGGPQRREDPVR